MSEFGWFLATIVVPVLSPFVVLSIFRVASNNLPASVKKRASFHALVKDGQLCWVALALGASCVYEIATAPSKPTWATIASTMAWTFIVFAAITATTGVLYPSKPGAPSRPGGWAWLSHHRQPFVSMLVLATTAASYTWVHLNLPTG